MSLLIGCRGPQLVLWVLKRTRLEREIKVGPNCFHRLGLDRFYYWYLNLACGFCNGAMRSRSATSAGTTLQFMLLIAIVSLSFL